MLKSTSEEKLNNSKFYNVSLKKQLSKLQKDQERVSLFNSFYFFSLENILIYKDK